MANSRGFSLSELLLVIGVLGFLSAMAIPNYSAFIIRSNRIQAEHILLQNQQYLEQVYSQKGSYIDKGRYIHLPHVRVPLEGVQLYQISFLKRDPPDPHTYTLIATPILNSIQANDGSICVDSDKNLYEHRNGNCSTERNILIN